MTQVGKIKTRVKGQDEGRKKKQQSKEKIFGMKEFAGPPTIEWKIKEKESLRSRYTKAWDWGDLWIIIYNYTMSRWFTIKEVI